MDAAGWRGHTLGHARPGSHWLGSTLLEEPPTSGSKGRLHLRFCPGRGACVTSSSVPALSAQTAHPLLWTDSWAKLGAGSLDMLNLGGWLSCEAQKWPLPSPSWADCFHPRPLLNLNEQTMEMQSPWPPRQGLDWTQWPWEPISLLHPQPVPQRK